MPWYFWLAILALILVAFVPQLLRLRIRFLRWVHWQWAVDVHEKYFNGLVLFLRIVLLAIAAILLFLSF